VIVRYRGIVKHLYFRGDAAFANPEVYELLEAEGASTIRLPANQVLQDKIGHLLKRPVERPPHEVRRYYASFRYQAQNWNEPRHVPAPPREARRGIPSTRRRCARRSAPTCKRRRQGQAMPRLSRQAEPREAGGRRDRDRDAERTGTVLETYPGYNGVLTKPGPFPDRPVRLHNGER
jgi:hypothetical protein